MELRHLRYFRAVAEGRSFSRAAEQLGVAQPPLSRQIRDLEIELGAELIDRSGRPIALTEAGRLLFDHAGRVLAAVDQLRSAMKAQLQGTRRRFVIGFVGSTIYGPVPGLIRRFRETAPDTDIELIEMNTVVQIAALKEGRIDAGLGRLTFDDPALRRRVIARERLVVALPIDHPLAGQASAVTLARLAAEPLILYPSEPRPSYADQVMGIFRDHDAVPRHTREVRELQTALGLVAAGTGLCVVPAAVQRLHRDDVAYRSIAEADATSPIILSWRRADMSQAIVLLDGLCSQLSSANIITGADSLQSGSSPQGMKY